MNTIALADVILPFLKHNMLLSVAILFLPQSSALIINISYEVAGYRRYLGLARVKDIPYIRSSEFFLSPVLY